MHIDFDPDSVNWDQLLSINTLDFPTYNNQFGGANYPIFRGVPYQRGAGIGSVFKSILRFLVPLGKEAGAAIGRQGLESTSRILSNVLEGKNVREALKDEARSGVKNLLTKAAERVGQTGNGRGKGRNLKRKKSRTINSDKKMSKSLNKLKNKKRKKVRIFSKISPPILPITKNPKNKSLHFDALGPY